MVCSKIKLLLLLYTQAGDFVHTLGDAHVYMNHIEPLKEQVPMYKYMYVY